MVNAIATEPRKSAPIAATTKRRASLDRSATPTRATVTAAIRLLAGQRLQSRTRPAAEVAARPTTRATCPAGELANCCHSWVIALVTVARGCCAKLHAAPGALDAAWLMLRCAS